MSVESGGLIEITQQIAVLRLIWMELMAGNAGVGGLFRRVTRLAQLNGRQILDARVINPHCSDRISGGIFSNRNLRMAVEASALDDMRSVIELGAHESALVFAHPSYRSIVNRVTLLTRLRESIDKFFVLAQGDLIDVRVKRR